MPLAALFERGENGEKFKQILNDLWARTHIGKMRDTTKLEKYF